MRSIKGEPPPPPPPPPNLDPDPLHPAILLLYNLSDRTGPIKPIPQTLTLIISEKTKLTLIFLIFHSLIGGILCDELIVEETF